MWATGPEGVKGAPDSLRFAFNHAFLPFLPHAPSLKDPLTNHLPRDVFLDHLHHGKPSPATCRACWTMLCIAVCIFIHLCEYLSSQLGSKPS